MSKKEDLIKILNNKHNFSIKDATEICKAVENYESEIRNSGSKRAPSSLDKVERQLKNIKNRRDDLHKRLHKLTLERSEIIKNSKSARNDERRKELRNKSREAARTRAPSRARTKAKLV